MILDCIIWPSSVTVIFDSYKVVGDRDKSDVTDVCRVSGYLKAFIENGMYACCHWVILFNYEVFSLADSFNFFFNTASSAELKSLIKFWIGWELPTTEMKVEIVDSRFPTALTCFEKLRLPRHYTAYKAFHQDLCACISTSYSGFGCV